MNWNKIKTFLIILLALANAFFAYMLIDRKTVEIYDNTTIDNVELLLGNSGIYCDRSLLLTKTRELEVYKCGTESDYENLVASHLSLSGSSETYLTPNGIHIIFEGGETLDLGDNFELSYISDNVIKNVPIHGDKVTDETTLEKVTTVLSKVFTVRNNAFSDAESCRIDSVKKAGSYIAVTCTQMLDGVTIYGNTVNCLIDGETVVSIKGTWCFMPIIETIPAQLYDSVNILFIEKNIIDSTEEKSEIIEKNEDSSQMPAETSYETEKAAEETSAVITKCEVENNAEQTQTVRYIETLEQCFCSYRSNSGGTLFCIPSWIITYKNGDKSIYNAVSGEKY